MGWLWLEYIRIIDTHQLEKIYVVMVTHDGTHG